MAGMDARVEDKVGQHIYSPVGRRGTHSQPSCQSPKHSHHPLLEASPSQLPPSSAHRDSQHPSLTVVPSTATYTFDRLEYTSTSKTFLLLIGCLGTSTFSTSSSMEEKCPVLTSQGASALSLLGPIPPKPPGGQAHQVSQPSKPWVRIGGVQQVREIQNANRSGPSPHSQMC